MKKFILAAAALAVLAPAYAQELNTEDEKTLYYLGRMVSRNLKQFNLTPGEGKLVVLGFSESLDGKDSRVDESYGQKIGEFISKKQEALAAEEKAKAKPFLDKAAKERGAKRAKSGLIYKETKRGKGASPKADDMVKVHYHGTFTDGKVFDSSVERKQPAEFPLGAVIPCWTEGVQMMKIGGKATLTCPSDIAYGDEGRPPFIPGGATLIFDVELLEIVKPEKPEAAPAPAPEKEAPKTEQK
ncbi:MAG: FKBP-type peptidyl-prolyl cis-trans isomerase FkpA [Elusimicrobia bacterium]|nr:MAG: FKBP-type peptidyl-prolyl cis-trans isomerase FkpA [Elusimicrobiota bacterium]KAF0156563.1 MAG: FKBP-type peptidyl-prolyl cis-trans isomerase FkpA [Elusimicrobiota bacterium]